MTDADIKSAVSEIVSLLAREDFDALDRRGALATGSKESLKNVVADYLRGARRLSMPPYSMYDGLDVYETRDPKRRRVDFDLWVDGERSDLTAQIYVEEAPSGTVSARLYDIRVL
ncbi:DUF7668 domain-containing protein [Burkholderia glumae]|uniref:DUF7668 domain-containing protein n=1 Tax=Burkholderia glumae TaxID=337 RepID=UPI00156E4EAE|nr:hypothetical protein [Burkholderia glumae]QKM57853.1 hypothetical protein CG017_05933 [Burkholderia glumae]